MKIIYGNNMLPFQGAIYPMYIPDPRRCLGLMYIALSALYGFPLFVFNNFIAPEKKN